MSSRPDSCPYLKKLKSLATTCVPETLESQIQTLVTALYNQDTSSVVSRNIQHFPVWAHQQG